MSNYFEKLYKINKEIRDIEEILDSPTVDGPKAIKRLNKLYELRKNLYKDRKKAYRI